MESTIIVSLLVVLIGLVGYLLWRQRNSSDSKKSSDFLLLQNQLNQLNQALTDQLDKNTKQLRENSSAVQKSVEGQLENSQDLLDRMSKQLQVVQKGLVKNQESTKQVLGITETLQSLEQTLRNQKQRGSLGEAGLQLILENMLGAPGELYETQYRFRSGETVDAVIKAKDGLICIDAKFSLDNYRRLIAADKEADTSAIERAFKNDLKKRIDETAKYIRPDEETLSFALMYIPAEGMYYDLLVNDVGSSVNSRSLVDYANEKNVTIVSPMTLYAYLHTILHGFNAFKIEKETEAIKDNIRKLRKHIKEYGKQHQLLGDNLGRAVGSYNRTRKQLVLTDKDILKITGESAEVEKIEIPRPEEG